MFRIVLSDTGLLKSSIPVIGELIDEGIFHIDQNGISFLSADRSMVAVVDFRMLPTAFDEFKVDAPDSLGLNLANLTAVLKRINAGDRMVLESGKDNKLKIKIEGNGIRTFELPLLDVKAEKPPIDQLKFPGSLELESKIVEDGIADAEVIGDSVIFEAEPEMFRMYARGDISSAQLEMKKGNNGLLGIHTQKNLKAQYPIEYLKKMIKAGKLSNQLLLEFGTDYPMRISFKIIDKMSISFILAPRVQE